MKRLTIPLLAALVAVPLAGTGARAALPGQAVLSIEMRAILIDPTIYGHFTDRGPIISVRAVEPIYSHVYEIKSPHCTALVTVVPKPWEGIGPGSNPTDYTVKVGRTSCR